MITDNIITVGQSGGMHSVGDISKHNFGQFHYSAEMIVTTGITIQ